MAFFIYSPIRIMKCLKKVAGITVVFFIIINIIAAVHAYKFTHFTTEPVTKTQSADKLSLAEKLQTLILGINNPRPYNKQLPAVPFETIKLQSNKNIECWYIPTRESKGTIILFHGYGGEKSSMLDKSNEFQKLGFNTLLVDFMGSGGSDGNQTTIGFKEAAEVKTTFDFVRQKGEKNILLFGTSLGAVAIMKAINDYKLAPKAIIIECPFGSMYQTTCTRFNSMHVPTFPMANLLVFWGGILNGFPAFEHKPTEYAKQITCPTLLLYGEKDEKVSRHETDEIFSNLSGPKELRTFPNAGHENYLTKYNTEWNKATKLFLERYSL